MGRALRRDVYVSGIRFPAGTAESDLPTDVKIPNPKAWSDSDEVPIGPTVEEPEPESTDAPDDPVEESESVEGPEDPGEGDDTSPIPKKLGPGSAAKTWLAYAELMGVTVPEDANREEIIAALDVAGVPTE